MLYPKQSQTREVMSLNGLWNFKIDKDNIGKNEKWYQKKLEEADLMAVPASYNDITVNKDVKYHVGDVWYEKYTYIPKSWADKKVMFRVGSASHNSIVYINGEEVTRYIGGFLPYEADITDYVQWDQKNHIVVCVNNELTWQSFPPGETKLIEDEYGNTYKKITQQHDFFNYAGIHRPVYLYTRPKNYIEDITVKTDVQEHAGIIAYDVKTINNTDVSMQVEVKIYDEDNKQVATMLGASGSIKIDSPNLWQPGKAYLYRMEVELTDALDKENTLIDQYDLEIGIRKVEIKDGQFLVNNKPVYFQGFGKHEDMDIKGKGLDHAMNLRDFELMDWIGANSFRTSHYPYAEEVLDLADRHGILVIGEVPAVGMLGQSVPAVGELDGVFREDKINDATLKEHIRLTKEMIARDKNHPSVVMWSLANEASTMEEKAEPYFKTLVEATRKMDDRPLLNVNLMLIEPGKCNVSKYFDVIGLNLYFGWYSERGNIEAGSKRLKVWLEQWYEAEGKPMIVTEYGVDTIPGLHKLPSIMFTEEYQVEFLDSYHKIFDELPCVIGEHVWNFADFMTGEDIVRIDGNKKGVFTRQRQPKMIAHELRKRWKFERR
ncbi:beta-glucuronidase [Vallitaleaceae bacterium 9-2]